MAPANLKVKQDTPVFSPRQFGEHLRAMRREYGFTSVDRLSDSILEETGVKIDRESLLRIERGQLSPDISKFMAICHTLATRHPFGQIDEMAVMHELITFAKPTQYLVKTFAPLRRIAEEVGKTPDEICDNRSAQRLAAAIVRIESDDYTVNANGDDRCCDIEELESF